MHNHKQSVLINSHTRYRWIECEKPTEPLTKLCGNLGSAGRFKSYYMGKTTNTIFTFDKHSSYKSKWFKKEYRFDSGDTTFDSKLAHQDQVEKLRMR